MRGAFTHGFVPSCSYYDEGAGRWDSAGLVIEAIATFSSAAGEQAGELDNPLDVNLTCLSFHLSDFTLSTEAVDAAFKTVPLASLDRQRFSALQLW